MAAERSRRTSRPRRVDREEDSEEEHEMNTAAVSSMGRSDCQTSEQKESERLQKIQEKNRKAQQKFRERRKEKMQSMEKEIATLEQRVLLLKTEKEHLTEQLAAEKRLNAENSSSRRAPNSCVFSVEGLQDFDPIDMSFLPQWNGLTLSNEKIRAMPQDTLKMLIQTILQDLRSRLASTDASLAAASLDNSVTAAFSFLNRCYLVEPLRYRQVVCEMMGPGGCIATMGNGHELKSLALTREQEMAISATVDTFNKTLEGLWRQREEICDTIKASRTGRGSELELMRGFLQVHGQIDALQSSLRRENELVFQFLTDVGRVLGPMQLTRAMFANGGQDIFTFCHAIHCRALLVNPRISSMPNMANGSAGRLSSAPGTSAAVGSSPLMNVSARGGGTGGMPSATAAASLQDSFLMQRLAETSAGADVHVGEKVKRGEMGRPMEAGAAGELGGKRPASPSMNPKAMFESPFLYDPGAGRVAAGAGAPSSSPFTVAADPGAGTGGVSLGGSIAGAGFQPPSFMKVDTEAACAAPNTERQNSFLELLTNTLQSDQRTTDPLMLSQNLRALLNTKDFPPASSLAEQHPAGAGAGVSRDGVPAAGTGNGLENQVAASEALGGLLAVPSNHNAMKGLMNLIVNSQSNTGAADVQAELQSMLAGKEGSRTLEMLTAELATSRTLSTGELTGFHGADAMRGQGTGQSLVKAESSAVSMMQPASSGPISGMGSSQRMARQTGSVQVTSGQ